MINEYPNSAERINWGAFFLTPIWALVYRKYFLLILFFIPYVGVIAPFIALIYGGKWAWDSKEWISEEEFIDIQNRWKYCGVVVWILLIVVFFLMSITI